MKNSSLVYVRFGIGSNGNNQNKWNACLSDYLDLTMYFLYYFVNPYGLAFIKKKHSLIPQDSASCF